VTNTVRKNASRHCKIRAASLFSYVMNTAGLAALSGSTYPVHDHHNDNLAQFAVSRCGLLMFQILDLLDS